VYCSRCRIPYSKRACTWSCTGSGLRTSGNIPA
jgi:hypothetical protein